MASISLGFFTETRLPSRDAELASGYLSLELRRTE